MNATWQGAPFSVWVCLDRRWDLLSLLIERGINVSRTYTKGDLRTAASFFATAIEEARAEGHEPEASLLRVQSLIIR